MARKQIFNHSCPCCNCQLNGWFTGDEVVVTSMKEVFSSFYFQCPKKSRIICMHTSRVYSQPVFWTLDSENVMDKSLKFQKIFAPYSKLSIVYLYFPDYMGSDIILEKFESQIKELSKDRYLAWAFSDFLEERVARFRQYFYIEWILDGRMFEHCRHTAYGSYLAERNVMGEKYKWHDCRLFSLYPTISPDFTCLNEIDLESVKGRLYSK